MGLTIHYTFVREKEPETLLIRAEEIAVQLGFKIEERGWNKLIINPDEKSEWIGLHFHKVKTVKKREGYDLESETIKRNEVGELDDEDWFCSGFIKTHYAGYKTHIKVAEFLRFISSYCKKVEIYDESSYYEAGYSKESETKLKEFLDRYNGQIGNLAKQLKGVFGKENIWLGGDV